MPKASFYKVVKELRQLGVLEVQSEERGEVPRVQYRLAIGKQTVADATSSLSAHMHQWRIRQLLKWGSCPVEERPHQLTIPQRILLIALLEEADNGGVVRSIGFAALSKRTGLAVRRVKDQIESLNEFHYIRRSLPGGNSPKFLGRFSSVHLLNLKHPAYDEHMASGAIVIGCLLPTSVENNELNFTYYLRSRFIKLWKQLDKRSYSSLINHDSDGILFLVKRLNQPPSPATWDYLNWRILDLASEMLTNHWEVIPEESNIKLEPLDSIIKNYSEIINNFCFPYSADNDIEEAYKNEANISRILACLVVEIGKIAKKNLLESNVLIEEPDNYYFNILPPRHDINNTRFAIEIFVRSNLMNALPSTSKIWFNSKTSEWEKEEIADLNELELRDLQSLGIASRPLRLPHLYQIRPKAQ